MIQVEKKAAIEEEKARGPKPISNLEELQAAIEAKRDYPGILTYISQNPLAASSSFTKVSLRALAIMCKFLL